MGLRYAPFVMQNTIQHEPIRGNHANGEATFAVSAECATTEGRHADVGKPIAGAKKFYCRTCGQPYARKMFPKEPEFGACALCWIDGAPYAFTRVAGAS